MGRYASMKRATQHSSRAVDRMTGYNALGWRVHGCVCIPSVPAIRDLGDRMAACSVQRAACSLEQQGLKGTDHNARASNSNNPRSHRNFRFLWSICRVHSSILNLHASVLTHTRTTVVLPFCAWQAMKKICKPVTPTNWSGLMSRAPFCELCAGTDAR